MFAAFDPKLLELLLAALEQALQDVLKDKLGHFKRVDFDRESRSYAAASGSPSLG